MNGKGFEMETCGREIFNRVQVNKYPFKSVLLHFQFQSRHPGPRGVALVHAPQHVALEANPEQEVTLDAVQVLVVKRTRKFAVVSQLQESLTNRCWLGNDLGIDYMYQ